MPTRVSRRFLLIGPSFAEKRVWYSQELPNFLQKYVAYTILSRKTCNGEQKLFLRINLHINAHKGIERIFAEKRVWFSQELPNFLQTYVAYTILSRKTCNGEQKLFLRINFHINAHKGIWGDFCWLDRLLLKNVYDLAKNFQIFFKNMLLTLFYLERHVMESKNYFWELIFILMPTRVLRGFLLKNVYDLAKNFQIFFKNMLLTLFNLERHVMESKYYFWELIFKLMPTRVSRRFLLIGPSFVENVYDLAKNFQIFFKNMLLTLLYLERHVMESKNYFWELIFTLMPTRVSRRFLLIGPSFAEKRVWFSQELPNFLQKYVAYTILSRKTCNGEQKLFLRINLHINAHKGIERIFAEKRVWFSQELPNFLQKYVAYTI